MASEVVTHDHETELHVPPPEVAPDVVTRELVATTSGASNAFKRTAWILGLLSVIGITALFIKWIDQGNDST